MKTARFLLGSFLFVAFSATASMAQSQRTFVSGLGNDGNPCSRTAPCRGFAQAISQTNSSGEVYVLDSAGYAAFTITKSISIVAPQGVAAGISVFSGDGIDINAGSSDTIILRGLIIDNQGSSGNGVVFNTGGGLIMEGCLIRGFSNNGASNGLSFQAGASMDIRDTLFVGNSTGITVSAGSASLDQVRFERNVVGIWAQGGSSVMMRNSIASHNTDGFLCSTTSSATAEMNIENCVSTYNHVAIEVESEQGTARVRLSNSTVTNNDFGLSVEGFGGPVLLSRGNNTVEGNTTNINGTIGSYNAK